MASVNRLLLVCILYGLFCVVEVAEPETRDGEDYVLNKTRLPAHSDLETLYDIIVFFLNDMVMPKTLGDLIESIDSFDYFLGIKDNWKEWYMYVIGFAICVLVGILFVLILPIVGICYCCCRLCDCGCCSHRPRPQGKDDKCKRVCCGTSLFLVTLMMVTAASLIFVTQDIMTKELQTEIVNDVKEGLLDVDEYANATLAQLDSAVIVGMDKSIQKTIDLLDGMGLDIMQKLQDEYHLDTMLTDLEKFVTSMRPLSTAFGQMENSPQTLRDLRDDLESDLNASRTTLDRLLNDVNCTNCSKVLDLLTDLTVNATYEINVTDVTLAKIALDHAIDSGIESDVEEGIEAYDDIENTIYNETEGVSEDIKGKIETVEQEVKDDYNSTVKQLLGNIDMSSYAQDLDTLWQTNEHVKQFKKYYWIGAACFAGLLLLIVLFAWLGLCCGACCKTPKNKIGSCTNTTTGASLCLMISIALTFIFGSFIMLVTLSTFVAGGGMEVVACRHLVTFDDTFDIYMTEVEDLLPFKYNISVPQAIDDCKHNRSVYVAANAAENGFNITALLDLQKVYETVGGLDDINIDIGNVKVLDDEVKNNLSAIADHLGGIDYTSYKDELAKDITKIDLIVYADLLDNIAIEINGSNPDVAYNITVEADMLREIANTSVKDMADERSSLQNATDTAQQISTSTDLDKLLSEISDAEVRLNETGSKIVLDHISGVGDDMVDILQEFADTVISKIMNEVGNCRSIYETLVSLIHTSCVYFLYPFNSLWFCSGWFLFCCVFHIIFATKLAGLYTHYGDKRPPQDWVELTRDPPPPHYAQADRPGSPPPHYDQADPHGKGQDNRSYIHDNPPPYPHQQNPQQARYQPRVKVLPTK